MITRELKLKPTKYLKKFIIFYFIIFTLNSLAYPLTPNPQWSPGHSCSVSDADFSEYRYDEGIPYCLRNVSPILKKSLYHLYNIPSAEKSNYTIDHIIPLSIGGSNNPKNLWPEHRDVKRTRENLEICLYEYLRDGSIRQKEAVDLILRVKFKLPHLDHNCLNK